MCVFLSDKVDEALKLASEVSLGRLFFMNLMNVIVSGISSPEQWREHLVQSGIPQHKFDTMLMFTYIDMGMLDKAEHVAKVSNSP